MTHVSVQRCEGDGPYPVVEELIPAPDPWEVARRLADWPRLIFLDSSDRNSPFARYSYVAAAPRSSLHVRMRDGVEPFSWLAQHLSALAPRIPDLPPFQGGIAGLFGYGLGRAVESLPDPEYDEFDLPDLDVNVYPWVVSFDHVQDRAWIVAHEDIETDLREVDEPLRFRRSRWLKAALEAPAPSLIPWHTESPATVQSGHHHFAHRTDVFSNFTRPDYEAAVGRIVDYIHAGDCFQVNLSQRLLAPLAEHPLELYGRLRARNPSPFGAYFDLGDCAIASASPERFLALSADGAVATRPIKGTRRRGLTPAEDFALRDDLLASAKDQAENLMIVDLLRNDLGRVCAYGSVHVAKLFEPESYATVHHLVSEVRGRLRGGFGAIDLLRAAFPGGSVTGAPKIRAMEIIAELERVARGPYCGSIGWIGFDGAMDTSI